MSTMSLRSTWAQLALSMAGLAVVAVATLGCDDAPYCFTDCDETTAAPGGGGAGVGGGSGGCLLDCGGGTTSSSGTGGGGNCEITNGGIEICDGIDNNCDKQVDEGIDFSSIQTCGTCTNNCLAQLLNTDPLTITCTWDGTPDVEGTCAFGECASDYYDIDPNQPGCEYYCLQTANDDSLCNNKDDDCDGVKDEDVDLCTDVTNCGACGSACAVVHGTGKCVDDGQTPCGPGNTHCEIDVCDDDNQNSVPDWHDLDGSYATGCEYQCEITNNGIEICGDGIDNDCDGKIDGADDDLSGDPQIGQVCYGDPDGWCADPQNGGLTVCQGQQVVCQGPNVLVQDQVAETCNGLDDDCDGVVDDNPTDAGGACGISNIFPCSLGTYQCQGGQLVCVGNLDPGTEICNGIDDDCDGGIDLVNGNPPNDSVGPCNVPTPPPPGASSPCIAGSLACVGGLVTCQGWTGPTGPTDSCGDDSNCDGVLDNQPDLNNDVSNCGSCGNDCMAGAVNATWICDGSGNCQFDSCLPGYWDLDNNQTCEYPCIVTGSEVCDGLDNDCNGQTDEGLTAPGPTQVCGVSPAATAPECTSQVSVVCQSGTWQCTFPNGVCSPNCAGATEICDSLDNDCDGGVDENVPNIGLPCASDDGLPPPGHGACRTQGVFVCNGPNAAKCSATKGSCAPNCDELCDGVDNDCDGLVDESFENKGSDSTYFVKPAVTRVANSLWAFSYEASRPNAGATTAGTGNGYFCGGGGCPPGIPDAPPGTVLDSTIACSVPGDLPWFNLTPIEVEQTCDAIGGFICDLSDWQTACHANVSCDWGYNPRGGQCKSLATGSKYCNLGPFDFDPIASGDQDGLLVTGSPQLQNCWADWSGLYSNTEPAVYDITGNLREITKIGSNIYPLMGGAFNSPSEQGATCDFSFYVVDQQFQLLDTGFRCCFNTDPRL